MSRDGSAWVRWGYNPPSPDKPSAVFQIQPGSPLQGPTRSPSSHSQT